MPKRTAQPAPVAAPVAALIDRIVSTFSPGAGLRRRQQRFALQALGEYDAATPARTRKFYRDGLSPNQLTQQSAEALRAQARQLHRNHDISRGILRTMVNNIVGPGGIGIEPQPRRADGTIHEAYAAALRTGWQQHNLRPEVTGRHTGAKVQRLACLTWVRDGEAFAQQVAGALVQAAQHATGMDDPVDAVAAARRSPQAVAAVEASVLAELDKLSPLLDKLASYSAAEWAADEAGREAGSRRGAQPLDDLGRMLARAGLVLASTVVVAVFVFAAAQFIRAGKVDPEVWAAVMLVIGWATGKVSTLFDFRFGSSHGSAALDAARSTINRNRS